MSSPISQSRCPYVATTSWVPQRSQLNSKLIGELANHSLQWLTKNISKQQLQTQVQALFAQHDIPLTNQAAAEFTDQLCSSLLHFFSSHSNIQFSVNGTNYANYTPGPSGLNPGDPRTYGMASNPGAWVLMGGATLLATSPIWVPAVGKVAAAGASSCGLSPQLCQDAAKSLGEGILKGATGMETGLPPDSMQDFLIGTVGEKIGESLGDSIESLSVPDTQSPCIEVE